MQETSDAVAKCIMTHPRLLYDSLRLNQYSLLTFDSKLVTLHFLRDIRHHRLFCWRTDEVNQLEPSDYIPAQQLSNMLISALQKLLKNRQSFAYRPLITRPDITPSRGIVVLLEHFKRREAYRDWSLK